MNEIAILQWLIVAGLFFVFPLWKICGRAGFKPALSFIALVPGGILVLLWIIAFARWPALSEEKKEL